MKLILIFVIIFLIGFCFSLDGKLYQYNQDKSSWEVVLANLPGSSAKYENQKPNFLFKTIVKPNENLGLKFVLNGEKKGDVKITSAGGTSHWEFVDRFGPRDTGDNIYFKNWLEVTYCAEFAPFLFNFTCQNKVFPCSISSRIDFGNMDHC